MDAESSVASNSLSCQETVKPCSKCGAPRDRAGQKYCRCCHRLYMRRWRPEHPPTEEQRQRGRARAYANVYQSRGILKPLPCRRCGADAVEKHHPDYAKPLDVVWFCRVCHNLFHTKQRQNAHGR